MTAVNSVGRTAAQMAAFVGNHNCVATINNFIPKADIDFYIKPQGLQAEPMLPPHLADYFHKFIMQVNVNPVRVAMNLQRFPALLENAAKVSNTQLVKKKKWKIMRHQLQLIFTSIYFYYTFYYFSSLDTEGTRIYALQRNDARR